SHAVSAAGNIIDLVVLKSTGQMRSAEAEIVEIDSNFADILDYIIDYRGSSGRRPAAAAGYSEFSVDIRTIINDTGGKPRVITVNSEAIKRLPRCRQPDHNRTGEARVDRVAACRVDDRLRPTC